MIQCLADIQSKIQGRDPLLSVWLTHKQRLGCRVIRFPEAAKSLAQITALSMGISSSYFRPMCLSIIYGAAHLHRVSLIGKKY
jgi:hypothetical protein